MVAQDVCPNPYDNGLLVFGLMLVLLSVGGYAQPHFTVCQKKSNKGLSLLMITLTCCTSGCFLILFFLMEFHHIFGCCRTPNECISNVLGFAIAGVSFVSHHGMFLMYTYYFEPWTDLYGTGFDPTWDRFKRSLSGVFALEFVLIILVLIVALASGVSSLGALVVGWFLFGLCSIFLVLQWTLRIRRTYMRKKQCYSLQTLGLKGIGWGFYGVFLFLTSHPAIWCIPIVALSLTSITFCMNLRLKLCPNLNQAKQLRLQRHPTVDETYEDRWEMGSAMSDMSDLSTMSGMSTVTTDSYMLFKQHPSRVHRLDNLAGERR